MLSEGMEGHSMISSTCVGTVTDVLRGARVFQETGLRLKIPGARTVTWSKGDAAGPTTSIRRLPCKIWSPERPIAHYLCTPIVIFLEVQAWRSQGGDWVVFEYGAVW